MEQIAIELWAIDYFFGVLRKMRESENCEEEIHEVIHEGSLDEKHDCNGFTINSISDNHAKIMQNPKLGDASLVCPLLVAKIMIGVMIFLLILKICSSLKMNMIFAILLKVGLEKS